MVSKLVAYQTFKENSSCRLLNIIIIVLRWIKIFGIQSRNVQCIHVVLFRISTIDFQVLMRIIDYKHTAIEASKQIGITLRCCWTWWITNLSKRSMIASILYTYISRDLPKNFPHVVEGMFDRTGQIHNNCCGGYDLVRTYHYHLHECSVYSTATVSFQSQ